MANEIGKLLEASLDMGEVIADSLSDNEFIKNIPIVGTFVKLVTGSLDLRDKLFAAKVLKFISELENISESDKRVFERKIQNDSEGTKRAGETAMLVLDKLNDLKKAELLGIYFRCFVKGKLNQSQFRRIADAIDMAFVDDIERFLNEVPCSKQSKEYFMEAIFRAGLTAISGGKTLGDTGEIYYGATEIGEIMHECWNEEIGRSG